MTLHAFYRTERAGAARLSDGGGPSGFDVTLALIIDDLLVEYSCDAIAETGCFVGDTTAYLACRYPHLPIYSCDNDAWCVSFTQHRLAHHKNVTVECADSPSLVTAVVARYKRPLFYLDAHWGDQWPLARELAAITVGVAVIHDFDIGHPRFAFDIYDGVACGPSILAAMPSPPLFYFIPDPQADHPLPCLQTRRRAGVGIVAISVDTGPLTEHPRLITCDVTVKAVAQ